MQKVKVNSNRVVQEWLNLADANSASSGNSKLHFLTQHKRPLLSKVQDFSTCVARVFTFHNVTAYIKSKIYNASRLLQVQQLLHSPPSVKILLPFPSNIFHRNLFQILDLFLKQNKESTHKEKNISLKQAYVQTHVQYVSIY